jgi:hypothetical protein
MEWGVIADITIAVGMSMRSNADTAVPAPPLTTGRLNSTNTGCARNHSPYIADKTPSMISLSFAP